MKGRFLVQASSPARHSEQAYSKAEVIALAMLFFGALAMRVLYLRDWALSPYYGHPLNDELYVHNWALDVLKNRVPREAFFRAPLYSFFVAGVYRIWGSNPLMVRVIQMLLGMAAVFLTYAIGRRWLGWKTAFLAAAIVATTPLLIHYDAELLSLAFHLPLDLAFLLAFLIAFNNPNSRWRWFAAGVLAGIAAIARPNIQLPAAVLCAYSLWIGCRHKTLASAAANIALLVLGMALPILPVTAFNRIAGNDRVMICSQAGVNLYLGNASFADGFIPDTPMTYSRPAEYHDSVEDFGNRASEELTGRRMKPSEVSAFWTSRTISDIGSNPARWIRLMIRKSVGFLSSAEVRNNKSPIFAIETISPWLGHLRRVHNFSWLAPLALAGSVILWKRHRDSRIITLYVIAYSASVIAFFVCSRFRAPIIPMFALLAAGGAHAAWQSWREHDRLWPALWFAILIAGAVVTNVDWFDLSPSPRRYDLWLLHKIHEEEGDFAASEKVLREALAEERNFADGLYSLGRIELARGNVAQAQALFEETTEADLKYVSAWNGLASIHRMQGRLDQARQALMRCLALDARHVNAWLNLAEIERLSNNMPASRRALETVIEIGVEPYKSEALRKLKEIPS